MIKHKNQEIQQINKNKNINNNNNNNKYKYYSTPFLKNQQNTIKITKSHKNK